MRLRVAPLALSLVAAAAPGDAGEISVFGAVPTPTEGWNLGGGAAWRQGFLPFVEFEGELSRQVAALPEERMTAFTASAILLPPSGRLKPYGGVGVGLFRQTRGAASDTGTLHAFILGAKWELSDTFLIRGDWRRITLSGTPLRDVDQRFALAIGIQY